MTQSVPDWEPYTQPIAPEGTPNVLYIVLDDVGYSAMGPYGGLIETPNIDRIAGRGLTYTSFHTTALCSPTRSCLMTGRNHLSHADHEIGRLLDHLEQSGQLDNTIIVLVSDNGASGEGGPNGSVNENKIFNGIADTIEANLPHLDDLGSPATYNHYPTGWAMAFNTPFKLWKRYSNWEGGTADPMIVSWPTRITSSGLRRQYVHAIDIVPTLYSVLGIDPPEVVKGYTQFPLEGVSFEATLNVKDGKLKYVYNFVGDQVQVIESTQPLPSGRKVLSASFEREGDTLPAEGTLTLRVGEEPVGQGRIRTQPGKVSIAGEGHAIGRDTGEPMTADYPGQAPWPFTGGTIHRAAVDVSGQPFVDLAAEVRMAFMRD